MSHKYLGLHVTFPLDRLILSRRKELGAVKPFKKVHDFGWEGYAIRRVNAGLPSDELSQRDAEPHPANIKLASIGVRDNGCSRVEGEYSAARTRPTLPGAA